jgi:hypothetical protein
MTYREHKMTKIMTKYFGEIIVNEDIEEDGCAFADVKYNNQEIRIYFDNFNIYEDKNKICFNIINKYVEINEIAKKAIIENYSVNKTIRYYFEYHFNNLEENELMEIFSVNNFYEMDIKNIVKKLKYPNLFFKIEENEIYVFVYYIVAKEYTGELLCVKMNKNLCLSTWHRNS